MISKKVLIVSAIIVAITIAFSSCGPSRKYGCPAQGSLITGTVHKPTKREIKHAMSYSSWEYTHPEPQIMISNSKSNFIFTTYK
jgi:hypothetical protein